MTAPIIFDRKVVLMQRAADFVRAGYRYWISGEVSPERLRALTKNFARLYGIDQTRHQRAYAKSKGDGCAVLLLYSPYVAPMAPDAAAHVQYPAPPAPAVRWILLVTPGDHPAHQLEHLRDATETAGRIVLTGYELVQLPRLGQKKPAWTWRMQDATYQGWRLRLITAARRRLALLTTEVAQLARTPGFAGCRAQAKKLMQLAASEWRRRHADEPPLVVPRVPYVQRLPDGGTMLILWLRRYTRQTSCVANTGVDAPATES